jgi:RluA family pseudouridine synthase
LSVFKKQVENLERKIRLSDYAHIAFRQLMTRSAGQKAIKKGHILFNGKKANSFDWVTNGSELSYIPPEYKLKEINVILDIVYEDDDIAVIIKPAGINVSGNRKSLLPIINLKVNHSTKVDALPMLTPLHRLDRDTKGLLLVAKTKSSQQSLLSQFESREIKTEYHGIVIGKPPKSGNLESIIDSKVANSTFELIQSESSKRFEHLSLLKVNLHTGRKHQIRIQMSELGFPILGDKIYCQYKPIGIGKGMFLFATKLTFKHPKFNKEMEFEMPIPPKAKKLL